MKKTLSIVFFVFILFLIKTTSAQNYGLSINSTATYAQVPLDPTHNITGSITLEAWIYPTSWTTESWRGTIISKDNNSYAGYVLRCGANGVLSLAIGTGAPTNQWKEITSPASTLVLNTWQHVAGVFNGTTLLLYVNGTPVGAPVFYTGSIGINTLPIEIGRSNTFQDRFFRGRIDEARIWNSAISAADILAYYNSTITSSNPNYASLVGYYEMDNYSTDTDSDGNFDLTATVGVPGEVYGSSYGPSCNPLFTSSAPTGTTSVSVRQASELPVSLGNTNASVIQVAVDVFNGATLSQLVFRTNGTTSVSDITNARVWYTGANGTFSTTSQFGTTINTPPAANNNMTFSATQTLTCGRHYFWLTYDILPTATVSNVIDGTFQSATIDGLPFTSATSNPTGSRTILSSCAHTLRMTASSGTLGWNGGQVDVYVNGVIAMSGLGANFLTGAGPKDTILYASTLDTIAIIRTLDGATVANMRISVLDGNGTIKIAATQPTTAGIGTSAYCGGIVTTNSATLITSSTAQLNGSFANCFPTETGFRYKKTTESVWNLVQDNDNPLTYVVQGLSAQTQYHYQAYAIVGSETIYGSVVTFTTACGAITALPWTDFFDSYGTGTTIFPACWTRNTTVTDRPYIISTNFSAPGSMYFFAGTAGSYNIASTPMFDATIPINTLKAEFKLRVSGLDDTMFVGVMTNPLDASTFQPVASIIPSSITVWHDMEVFFNNYTGTGQYIAFKAAFMATSSTIYLDNVQIFTIPTCPRPSNVVFSNILPNSANVSWTENGTATTWEIEYGPTGFALGTGTVESNITTLPHTIYNLNPQTSYQVYVKAICSASDISLNTIPVSFMTACGAITTLPYNDFFDTYGTGGTSNFPTCWVRNSAGTTTAPYISSTNFSSPGSLYFSASSTTINRVMGVTPLFDPSIPINTLKTEFKMRVSGLDDSLVVGVMDDPTNISTFTAIATLGCSSTLAFQDKEVFFTNYTGTGQYIAYRVNYGPTSAIVYLDNVSILTIPSCPRPTSPMSNNITTTTADLSWNENGTATTWEIEYGPVGFIQGTGTIASNITTNPFTLTNLNASTQYTYYVKAVCSTNDVSIWSVSNTFTTLCDPIATLPVVETFETTVTGQIPVCYNRLISGTATVGVTNSDGSMVLNFNSGTVTNNCFLILPLTVDPVNTLRIMFKYYGGANHLFKIGYMTDPLSAASFVELHNAPLSTSGTWKTFDLLTNNTMVGNERIAIRFVMASGFSARIDSLTIMNQPPCVEPTGLVLTNSGINDATVSWVGTTSLYNLEYKEVAGTTWTTLNNVTAPYNISGLLQNTDYQFRVQTICDGGVLSGWSPTASFSTLCDLITVLPYVQDFESTITNTTPLCYDSIASNSGVVRVINHSTFGKVLEMSFQATTGNCYIILPKINFPINTLRISFKYFGGTTNHRFGYITNPSDPTTFVEILNQDMINSSGEWKYIDLLTNNTLTGNERIAIRYNGSANFNNRYDSLTVDIMPSCLPPFGLTSSAITTTGATLNWSPAGTGTPVDYTIQYRPLGETTWNVINNVTPPYILTPLSSSTTYQYQVKANCGGGDLSDWSIISSFMTACGSITTLPWSESFDTYGTTTTSFPTCWTKTQSAANSFYISTTNFSAPGSLYSYLGTAGSYNIAVTPMFDATIPINTLKAEFKYRVSSNDDTLYIGVMSIPTDPTTFELISKKVPSANTTFQTFEVYFNNYTGTGQYIAFKTAYTASTSTSYMDNVLISTIPACPTPSFLTSSNVGAYSADLAWTENGTATSWVIEYGPTGFTPGTGTMVTGVYTNPYTLQGLSPNTSYQVYVQSDCSGSYSAQSNVTSFTTALIPIALPYYNDFENPSTYSDFGILNGTQVNKFVIGSATGVNNTVGGANALYISNDNGTTWAYTGGTTNASRVYTYLDIAVPTGVNELLLDFDWIANGALYNFDFLRVYLIPVNIPVVAGSNPPIVNSVNYDTQAQIGNYIGGPGNHWLSVQTTWQHKQFSINTAQFPNLAGNTWRLYFHWRNDQATATQPPATIDNIAITIPTCPTPSALVTSNILTNSVDLTWTENGTATTWNIEYGPTGFTPGTGTSIPGVTTNPYTITGLTPQTTYQIYVKSVCSVSDLSANSAPKSVTTACGAITTLPWSDSFDTYGTGTTIFPSCWTRNSSVTTNPYISSTNNSAPGSLYFYMGTVGGYSMAVTPMFDATIPINTLKAEFKLRVSGLDDTMFVGVMTDPTIASTFQPIASIIPSSISVWHDMEVFFSNYTGTGQYIAFRAAYTASAVTIYLDNVQILAIPTCPRPTQVSVSNVMSNSLNLNWVENGSATQWQVQYGPAGFALGTGTMINTSTNPLNIVSLTSSTSYDFYVRAICGVGDTSIWSVKTVGTTACVPITTLPWNEGFETISAAGQLPVCWSATNLGTMTNTQIVNSTSYNRVARTGTKAIYFRYGCNDRFFTPGFQLTAGVTYNFSYWYITDGLSGWSTLQLGAYSGQTAGTLVQTINTITSPIITTYTQVNATYTPTTSGVFYFGVYCQSNSTPWYLTMDDFSLTAPTVSCASPTNLAVSAITQTQATTTWTAGGTETSWQVAYKPSSTSTWMTAIVNTTPTYLIPSLTAGTAYDVKVRAICAPGDTSAYTAVVNFTTTSVATCPAPTGLTVTNNGVGSVSINWTENGTATQWEVDYKLASASAWTTITATSHPYFLMGLITCSDYNFRVRAVCSAGLYSNYTAVVNFTTPAAVPTNVQVPTISITDQSAVATWTPGGTETQWQVEYKLVSSSNWTSATVNLPQHLMTGLQSNSNYEVRVKAICSATNESAYTTPIPFTTLGGATYTITATAFGNGTITPSGIVTINAGANQTFNFTPDQNHLIVSVLVDGTPITGTPASYTFTNILANHTIHAEFSIIGIEENGLAQLVELFPNPTTSIIELRLKADDLHIKECKVYDMYGKLMRVIPIDAETTSIDVTDFASGVYFVRMDSERGTISKKFVKK